MRIDFKGRLVDEPEVRAGFIGCGSHSFRNLYPVFQFAPVDLVAVCDLDARKARAFAAKSGARTWYTDFRRMLEKERLDAVFICTGYDSRGRPTYPALAIDCLRSGRHVWIEKPPAATTEEIDAMSGAAREARRQVGVGMKKMFFPANQKAKELMDQEGFGAPELVMIQYPQRIPTLEECGRYLSGCPDPHVQSFLDHLCHPASVLVYLLGIPESLYYDRSSGGAGMATFHYASGVVGAIAFTHGASRNGGMERLTIVSRGGTHITVENNLRVTLHRVPPSGYGDVPDFFAGPAEQASAVWEPEFSLGQLYNKGLFLLGYYNEINEFARAILDNRCLANGTLEQARQVTRIFEAFSGGPGRMLSLA